MKTSILLTVAVCLLFLAGNVRSQEITGKNTALLQGSATVISTPDLYELTSKWVSEYNPLNPGKNMMVIKAANNSVELGASGNLSFITNKSSAVIDNEKSWKMVVGRDVIVPVMNAENPFLQEIEKQGVSPASFARIFNSPEKQDWGTLVAKGQNSAIHLYLVGDESIKTSVAKFLQLTQIPLNGIIIGTKDEVVSAVQNDPYAIGFCKFSDILITDKQGMAENIRLLPIDKNGNGTLDYMEDIYSDANAFFRGLWIGKYPKTLYSNIFVVSTMPPTNETELAFLSWVLTDGQKYMNSSGFCELADSESLSQLEKINTAVISVAALNDTLHTGFILLVLAVFLALNLIIGAVVRSYRKRENVIPDLSVQPQSFTEEAVILPHGLYFDKSHTWAFMEKDGNVSIGIDDFLQHITGPVTCVEMKNPGMKFKKGDPLFSIIQSGKQLSMYAPVSGAIVKQNEALAADPGFINSSPYSEGWVYRIKPSNWDREIRFLDMAEKYKRWIDNEFSRVKDFLAATLKPESLEYSHVVMQDGGLLKDGVLADFGPEVWEDFQTNFLDYYK